MSLNKAIRSDILDLKYIKEYFSEDQHFTIELIEGYLSDTIPKVDILEKNLINLDYDEVKNISHFFKPSFSLMGIKCLQEIIDLEKLAENKAPKNEIYKRINFIIPICRESILEYKRILNEIKTI